MKKGVRESILGYENSMFDDTKTRNSMIGVNAEGGVVKDKAREGPIIKCPNFNLIQRHEKPLKDAKLGPDTIKFAFQADDSGSGIAYALNRRKPGR